MSGAAGMLPLSRRWISTAEVPGSSSSSGPKIAPGLMTARSAVTAVPLGDLPGGPLRPRLGFDVGVAVAAFEIGPVGPREGLRARFRMTVHHRSHRRGQHDPLDLGRERGFQRPRRAFDGRADQIHLVGRHAGHERRCDVLDIAHAVHGLRPAFVGHEVECHELQLRRVGAGAFERLPHLVGPLEIAHAAAHGVAGLEQLQGDMPAEETGNAGQEDAIGHGMSPLCVERNL